MNKFVDAKSISLGFFLLLESAKQSLYLPESLGIDSLILSVIFACSLSKSSFLFSKLTLISSFGDILLLSLYKTISLMSLIGLFISTDNSSCSPSFKCISGNHFSFSICNIFSFTLIFIDSV